MFSTMEKEMDDVFDSMNKEMDEAFKNTEPTADGSMETVTETETKPDGTVTHRKITRRVIKKVERSSNHKFVARRTDAFQGPPEETCEHCGKDPRNIIHEV